MGAYDPVLASNGLVAASEGHRAKIEQTRENSARLAQAYSTSTTGGDGEFQVVDAIMFGATFTEQPMVSYGYSLDGTDIVPGALPKAFGFVREWVRDSRGFYTGAFVCFVVETSRVVRRNSFVSPPPDDEDPVLLPDAIVLDIDVPIYVIEHDLTFTGIAIKDLPDYLLDITT